MSTSLQSNPLIQKLAGMNEAAWINIGSLSELMSEPDRAMKAYESALRHNPYSFTALFNIAALYRSREQYGKATDYFQRALNIEGTNGEVWGALGHCYLMMDDLQKAYSAYQQALYHMPNPKEPKLWYGIGILYDRYGSLEHAEEAFSAVMRMDSKFDKGNEIYFRLGIIYKQQLKFDLSLQCFRYILGTPPRPLTEVDIWFQIGHVYEQQKEYVLAKEAYERVLNENPSHAKVLQQLGWLYHQNNAPFSDQEKAISYLNHSIDADGNDAQTWYLLGRCYMAQSKYNKAYEAYQQAVYRDGKNPTFWCSIGVLYYQINQFRDALDAYSRAIRLNPHISEVWYDLGTLYESCNNQIEDARDAYNRALELDPSNSLIRQRLAYLNSSQTGGNAPVPQDVNPSSYQNNSYASGNGHIAQFNQGPLGPAPGVQAYPTRNENQSTMPPPLQFSQGNGERPPASGQEHLAPLSHLSKVPSPNPRGSQTLPTIMKDEPGRYVDNFPSSRPHPGQEQGHPAGIPHGMAPGHDPFRAPPQPGYLRQPIKRMENSNGSMGIDNRKMSCPSPGMMTRPPNLNQPHRGPEGPYYSHEQPPQQHGDRRESEDPYKHRGPPQGYSRPDHPPPMNAPYPNDRHPYQMEPNYATDMARRQHLSARPSPHMTQMHDRPHMEERSPFIPPDNRHIPEEKLRTFPAHLTRPNEHMASPKFSEPRGPPFRNVDEDYDGAADALVSISQSAAGFKTSKQPSPKPILGEPTSASTYHPSQRATPLPSPKNANGEAPRDSMPSKSPSRTAPQS